MIKKPYRPIPLELTSEQTHPGEWIARVMIIVEDGKSNKKIPILDGGGEPLLTPGAKRTAYAMGAGQALD